MIGVVWIVISFGPLCYVWIESCKTLRYANVVLISLFVVSVTGGLAPGSWRIYPFIINFAFQELPRQSCAFAFINYYQGRLSIDSGKISSPRLAAWAFPDTWNNKLVIPEYCDCVIPCSPRG